VSQPLNRRQVARRPDLMAKHFVKYTGCLQTLIPSRCEHVPWVMRNQNHHRTMGLFRFV
jgi:hypothetical protein